MACYGKISLEKLDKISVSSVYCVCMYVCMYEGRKILEVI